MFSFVQEVENVSFPQAVRILAGIAGVEIPEQTDSGEDKRKSALKELSGVPGTLVFYESPKRVAAMLRDAAQVLGGGRRAAVCRELTKKFEEVLRGSLDELADITAERPLKGEIVVLVEKGGDSPVVSDDDLDSLLQEALQEGSVRDAADRVAEQTGLKRRQVYQRALELSKGT